MSTPDAVSTLLSDALSDVVALYADSDWTPGSDPLPDLQYIHVGEFVIDCESVTVSALSLNPTLAFGGEVGPPGTPCVTPTSLQFVIAIARCVPVPDDAGRPPTSDDLTASALTLAADGWMLSVGLHLAHAAGTFLPGCQNLVRVSTVAIGPEGGYGGWASTWVTDVV